MLTLDDVRLAGRVADGSRSRYLDKLNFATNFAFFRDADGLHTRLVSANYWASYGAADVRLWLRLFDADGTVLATWEQPLPSGPGGFSIDSRAGAGAVWIWRRSPASFSSMPSVSPAMTW